MKKTVIWLLALLMLCTTACAMTLPADLTEIGESAFEGDESLQGVVVLPEGTTAVGARAFADTDVYALQVPAGCTLSADVLSGTEAAYIRLAQYAALDPAVLDDVSYVFVEAAGEDALALPYMLTENTVMLEGLICLAAEDGLYPLCPADRTALPETVVIPKLVGERPVVSLDMLVMPGGVDTSVQAPAYLAAPEGMEFQPYETMTASASVSEDGPLVSDEEYTFAAAVDGAYGDCIFRWTFTLGEETVAVETAQPVCTYTPAGAGELTVAVQATDSLGDTAQSMLSCAVSCGGITVAAPVTDDELTVGSAVTFTAEAACDCEITGYTWTITDGTNTVTYDTTEPVLVWTPDSKGHHILYVKAMDAAGNTAEMSLEFIAVCGGVTLTQPAVDKAPSVGMEVTFTTEAVCDCEITGYTWMITNGTIPENFETTEPTLSYTPTSAGSYTLTVKAADAAGNAAEASLEFLVPCRGIAVQISAADESPAVWSETTFTASAICDCDIVSYTWTITDGVNTETYETAEPILGYTPVSVGSHTLTVMVTDAEEYTAEAVCTFVTSCRGVRIEAPTADSNPAIGMETIFTANATCDCGIISYTWTITDDTGSKSFTATDSTCAYTPTVMGSCLVAVTATDMSGVSVSAETVFDVPCRGVTITQPIADAAPVVGAGVTFTTTAACDCEITGYTWTITDGTTSETFETTEPVLSWTPQSQGHRVLYVKATDAAGNTAEMALEFIVACRGVMITQPAADAAPVVGTEMTFTAEAACDCEITGYTWTITDGMNTETAETTEPVYAWTPVTAGSYTLTVCAADAAGNTAEDTLVFDVPCRGVSVEISASDDSPAIGTETTFSASAICDCEIVSYTWTVTDSTGSTVFTTTDGTLAFTPAAAGSLTVLVTAADAAGNTGAAEAVYDVPCSGVTVTVSAPEGEPAIGTEMTFTAEVASSCEIVSYTWVLTDSVQSSTTVTTEPVLTIVPAYADIYSLTVTAEEQHGETAEACCDFTVPCSGIALGAIQVKDGFRLGRESLLSVTASCDCSAMYYYWTIQTDEPVISILTTEPVLAFTPEAMLPHQVTVTITDALGNTETAEASIEVLCGGVTVSEPAADTAPEIGVPAVFTTQAECDCGIVSYTWTITDGDLITQETTTEPSITYTPVNDKCIVSVTAMDAQGGFASAYAEFILSGSGEPVYRAVLIGNTYPDTDIELGGCDTDVYAMRSMLKSMTGTPFTVTCLLNQTASGMQGAISSAFADADDNDVSLFYYSGHGTSTGMLVGTSSTYVAPAALRSWLDTVPGTKIVILDCCYSGMSIAKSEDSASPASFNSAIISAFSWISREGELAANGYYVLTACSKNQTSLSLSDGVLSFGAFTYSLCYGCGYDEWNQLALSELPADSNGDKAITMAEAIGGIQERIAYLNGMVELTQAMQYHGDTSYTLWIR